MIPYAVSSMSEMGAELLYLPASLAHNIAEAGACFAVSPADKRSKASLNSYFCWNFCTVWHYRASIVYGVTILTKRVLYGVMASSLVGGAVAGIFTIKAFAISGSGVLLVSPCSLMNQIVMNLVGALVTLAVSFSCGFCFSPVSF